MTESEQNNIFGKWLQQHKGQIFKVIRAYAATTMDQDDLFQEIMIQVWHSIPTFREESSVNTWVYRIALNTAIKWVGKEQKYAKSRESLDTVQAVLQEAKVPPDERLNWLYQEIHKLDEIDRSITLLLLDGFSYKEMASMLGITESNVGVKINRIKKQLIARSKQLNPYGI
ncbi:MULTISPECIES: RNA polymerase sigma factor [unclassified Spirosoma]|uniref:RNA polymerase sigma factor n=1 Tax=unclassified Spirosoma TaxID=2621999 RepID=UPI000968F756|nr:MULTISPECIES: RNA polymerase sigma factor [unclassified Spirosoma]MBN8822294.1 RNA polymerase sigma factor [Spirosoma sp.]OJW72401.1 MAG: RNA polymerase subunit sigma-70 [Spirosoma sp. 48-14]